MHEIQTIVTDVCGVCLSVCLSVTPLKLAAAHAVYASCRVRGVIRCSLRQMPLASCFRRMIRKLTGRSGWRVKRGDVDVRDSHWPLIVGLTALTVVDSLTFARPPPILGATTDRRRRSAAASERLTGNHISRFAISLLYSQSADIRHAFAVVLPTFSVYAPRYTRKIIQIFCSLAKFFHTTVCSPCSQART